MPTLLSSPTHVLTCYYPLAPYNDVGNVVVRSKIAYNSMEKNALEGVTTSSPKHFCSYYKVIFEHLLIRVFN